MLDPELLSILCCPETRQALSFAPEEAIRAINQRIDQGQVTNRAGKSVSEKLESGLVRADQHYLYPIRNRIPILLVDEGIPLGQAPGCPSRAVMT
jgi:uncharacterized protein YbaR (Trm112 family)